jgi:DNA replication protein DnaC
VQPAQQQLSHQRSQYGRIARLQRCQAEPEQQAAAEHPFPEEADFDLLSKKVAELTQYLNQELRGCSIYLVGMMGSGKSTVGGCTLRQRLLSGIRLALHA